MVKRNDGMRRRRALTLIELVTSTASVAALMTLLLPAMGEARRGGQLARCLGNLSRLGEASAIYAGEDSNELAIPVHPLMGTMPGAAGELEWGGKSGVGEPLDGADPLASKWGTQVGRGPASRPFNQVLYGDVFPDYVDDPGPNGINWLNDTRLRLGAFRCPADDGYSGHNYAAWQQSGLTSYDHYGNSYAANTFSVGIAGANCQLMSNTPFLRPVSDVPNPGKTLLFMENAGHFAWRKNYGADECLFLSAGTMAGDAKEPVFGWHGRPWIFQTAFVDGHADSVYMEGHQQPQPELHGYPDLFGNPTSYSDWHCVIIRGEGWRIDTLPAAPVSTNMPCGGAGVPVQLIQ